MNNSTNSTNTQIKILRRPAQSSTNSTKGSVNTDVKTSDVNKKNKNVTKTYEEREAEYAQARLRILGAAYPDPDSDNDEDEKKADSDLNQSSTPTATSTSNSASSSAAMPPLVNGIIKKQSSSPELQINSSIIDNSSGIAVRSDS